MRKYLVGFAVACIIFTGIVASAHVQAAAMTSPVQGLIAQLLQQVQQLQAQLSATQSASVANVQPTDGSGGGTTPPVQCVITPPLQYGSKGAQVSLLQSVLAQEGSYADGTVTGFYGKLTMTAVQIFQKKNNLSVTGAVNQVTAKALNAIVPQYSSCGSTTGGIMVTAPKANDVLNIGGTYTIGWTRNQASATASLGTVTITMATPLPACLRATPACAIAMPSTVPYVIASKVANTGTYTWTIPATLGAAYQGNQEITITVDGTNVQGVSGTFSVKSVPAGTLQIGSVTPPSGTVGTPYSATISATGGTDSYTWSIINGSLPPGITQGQSSVVCIKAPCQVPMVLQGTPTTAGSYSFTVQVKSGTQTTTAGYGIQILPQGTKPSITVVSPNGGETIQAGTTYDVRWNATNVPSVNIYLCGPAASALGSSACLPLANIPDSGIPASQGKFSWYVDPGTPFLPATGAVFKIKVVAVGADAADSSDTSFSITSSSTPQPSITVTYPVAGMILDNSGGKSSGLIANIMWTTKNFGDRTVELDLVAKDGSFVKNIAANVPNTGMYAWKYDASIPNGNSYRIYAASYDKGPSAENYSGYFTLAGNDASVPSITVLSPADGQQQGLLTNPLTLTWTSNYKPKLPVAYVSNSAGGGAVYMQNLSFSEGADKQVGSIPVSVFPVAGQYQIQVCDNGLTTSKPLCSAANKFTVALSSISVLSPTNGQQISVGGSITGIPFTWTSNYVPKLPVVVVSPTVLGASAYTASVSFTPGTDKQFGAIPASAFPSSGQYQIQVCDNGSSTGKPICSTAVNLSITTPIVPPAVPTLSVTAPTAGNEWAVGSSHAITWTASNLNTTTDGVATIALSGGSLAMPLTVAHVTTASGQYTWTIPTTLSAGSNYKIRVYTSGTLDATSNAFAIIVPSAPLTVTTASVPAGTVGQTYSASLQATGGSGNYQWSVANGSLPTGLSLAGTPTSISGTPTVAGAYTFVLQVSDGTTTALKSMTLTVAQPATPSPLAITPITIPAGSVGAPYSISLQATGGSGTYSWSYFGTIPPGLSVSGTSAPSLTISGTPTQQGAWGVYFYVSSNGQTANVPVNFSIGYGTQPDPLVIQPLALSAATVGSFYYQFIYAVGGYTGYTWSLAGGSLPPGMTLSMSPCSPAGSLCNTPGILGGYPTTPGTYNFSLKVTDGTHSATQDFVITVNAASVSAAPAQTMSFSEMASVLDAARSVLLKLEALFSR